MPRCAAIAAAIILSLDTLALIGVLAITHSFDVTGLVCVGTALAVLVLMDQHTARLDLRLSGNSFRIVEALFLSFFVAGLMPFSEQTLHALAGSILAAVALVHLSRLIAYGVIRQLRRRGILAEHVLIVGTGEAEAEIFRVLREHPEYGLIPLRTRVTLESLDLPALEAAVRDLAVTRIIIALDDVDPAGLLRLCAALRVRVHVLRRLVGTGVDDVWGFPLVQVRHPAGRGTARHAKRAFDLVVGTVLLVLAVPVFALAAVAVRLSSPGPVFFRQKRIGENGQVIEMLKFRTLLCNDDSDETWFVGKDDRRTFAGRILRRTGLDELPQILNVLRGDMSLVGPRPERPYFANRFSAELPRYRDRQRVPQGITGWAQVHGLRGDTPISDRVRFDNYYIEHWSLWRDLVILARTPAAMLGKRGA